MSPRNYMLFEDDPGHEALAGLAVFSMGVLAVGHGVSKWAVSPDAKFIVGFGILLLVMLVVGLVLNERWQIEFVTQAKTVTVRKSNRFGETVQTYRYGELRRVAVVTEVSPDDAPRVSVYLHFADGRRVEVPSVPATDAEEVAERIAATTGAAVSRY